MKQKRHFIHLFKYNDWATQEAAKSLWGLEKKRRRARRISLPHYLSAANMAEQSTGKKGLS